MNWINTKDKLPEEGKYVLARHNRGNWVDSTDQENVNCIVVKLVRGISIEEREKMKKGELPQTLERSQVYKAEDEYGNNIMPYNWQMFGPDSFFGQTITHWMPIKSTGLVSSFSLWWIRTFKVISNQRAKELGLRHRCNVYGDEINKLNCRSIWLDSKRRQYRVSNLEYHN